MGPPNLDRNPEFGDETLDFTRGSAVKGMTPPPGDPELESAAEVARQATRVPLHSDEIVEVPIKSSGLEAVLGGATRTHDWEATMTRAGDEAARLATQAQVFKPTVMRDEEDREVFFAGAKLGEGGFGAVYDAEDLRNESQRVALKVLRDPTYGRKRRFAREGLIAKDMDHPNIAKVLDVGALGEDMYISMEFLPGQTKGEDFGWRRAAEIARDTLDGLMYAHERGVRHRDLKPDNILLDKDGNPKIVDWGLAREEGHETYSLTAQDRTLGTLIYLPPEQIGSSDEKESIKKAREDGTIKQGFSLKRLLSRSDDSEGISEEDDRISDRVDERSDVYSMGLTLSELAGAPLRFANLDRVSGMEYIRRIADPRFAFMSLPAELNPEMPQELQNIILKATHHDPDKRYQTAKEFKEDLERLLEDDARDLVASSKDTKVHENVRWRQTHPGTILGRRIAAGALAVSLLVGGAVGIARSDSDLREIDNDIQRAAQIMSNLDLQDKDHRVDYESALSAEKILEGQIENIFGLVSQGASKERYSGALEQLETELENAGETALQSSRDWFNTAEDYQDKRDAALAYATRLAEDRVSRWLTEEGILPRDGSIPITGSSNGEDWSTTETHLHMDIVSYLRLMNISGELTGNEMFREELEKRLSQEQVADALTEEDLETINNHSGSLGSRGATLIDAGRSNVAYRLARKLEGRVTDDGILHFSTQGKDSRHLRTKYLDNLYLFLRADELEGASEEDVARFKGIAERTMDFAANKIFDGKDVPQAYDLVAQGYAGSTSPIDRAVALEMFSAAANEINKDKYRPIADQLFETITEEEIADEDLLGLARTAYASAVYAKVALDGRPAREYSVDLLRRVNLDPVRSTVVRNSRANKNNPDNPDMKALDYAVAAMAELSLSYADQDFYAIK